MKFVTEASILALAAGTFAKQPTPVRRDVPSLVERDVATISNVVMEVDMGIKNLDSAVQAFNRDPTPLQMASMNLQNTIKTGTKSIQATSEITLQDAIMLQTFVTSLQGDGQSLVTNLESKKADFEKAGLCDLVREQVSSVSSSGSALIDAVVSKVPESARTIASQLAGGFTATLAQSEGSFAAGNCTNAAGTGTGTSTGGGARGNATMTGSPVQVTGAAAVNVVGASVGILGVAVAAILL
jgi:hypothetical protein